MNLWAISDLHLGFSTGKWMDPFGEHWRDHHLKVEQAWIERVRPDDIVLMPGDFSWAMKAVEVVEDFRWLAALPGRKVLVKGNHDYWWPGSHRKLAELLPPGVFALKKRALVLDGLPIVGVRGCDFLPRDGDDPAAVHSTLLRERHELLLSIEDLEQKDRGSRPPVAMFHYPPFRAGGCESAFTRIIEDLGCRHCVFGHLHAAAEWQRVFQGERRGVSYKLVSCDALGFVPLLLEELGGC
jgi:hypothetical protein